MNIFRYFIPAFKKNWKVVLLSVFGATTFWFFNAMSKNYNARLDYPVNYVFGRDSVVVVEPLQDKVKIHVQSGGWNLLRKTFRVNATPINIPLENPTDIRYLTRGSLIPMIREQLDGLELTYLVTDTLFFHIEKKVTKTLPVVVDSLQVPLADNHRMVSPIVSSTDSVKITGPSSFMAILPPQMTVRWNEADISSDYDEDLRFNLLRDELMLTEPAEVRVSFDVDQFVDKSLSIPVESLNFPEDSSVYPVSDNIEVHFIVNENEEDEVTETDFHVIMDWTLSNPADTTISPFLINAHEKALDIILIPDKIKLIHAEAN